MEPQSAPSTLLINARVYTMDPAHPMAEAVAWRGDRIVSVGSSREATYAIGHGATIIDAGGRTVLPGLIDAHIHFTWYARSLRQVDLDGVPSLEESLRRVGARAAAQAPGTWVQGHGWDNNLWTPPDFPTRADLDRVVPQHPVLLRRKD